MTEQEAIEELKCYRAQSGTSYPEEIEVAIKALEEIQKYREIGTVEECRKAVEKQKAKKPKEYEDKFYACAICGNVLLNKWEKYPSKLMDKKNGLPY